MPSSKIRLWLFVAIGFYATAHLLWYLGTPLGMSPVLDGQENLILARQIKQGTLPVEPFYRAMLYPALLSALPIGHALLGLICHLANAFLTLQIARRFWSSDSGALLAAAFVGFNPVLLHFAFDPLDITLAITLFLGALSCLQRGLCSASPATRSHVFLACAGALLSLASLARPHFVALLLPLLTVAAVATIAGRLKPRRAACFIFAAALPLLAYGLVQKSHSGSFSVLPWQGAYNLWSSNGPNANGLYYTQSLAFHSLDEHKNPNRMESEAFYLRDNGQTGAIAELTRYWRSKTIDYILDNPVAWLKLEAFKLYAVFNDFEQYNNKTYSFHKSLSPWLRYNPISWGILLILAATCSSVLWHQKRRDLLATLFIAGAFGSGLLLYMASARFRLPLVPILAILTGGVPLALAALRSSGAKTRRRAAITGGIAAALAFSSFGDIRSKSTYIQDTMLLADASARIGDDLSAIRWADSALAIDPTNQPAKRLRVLSRYNLVASGQTSPDKEFWRELAHDFESIRLDDERLSFIGGVIQWNVGERAAAQMSWNNAYDQQGLKASASLSALLLTDPFFKRPRLTDELVSLLSEDGHVLLAYAFAADLSESERPAFLQAIQLSEPRYLAIGSSLQRILPIR